MKFLVLAACVSVSASQGFFGLQAHPNGAITPIDEPAVAAARAEHLATKFGAGGYVAGYGAGVGYSGYAPGYAAGYGYAPGYTAGYGYNGYAGLASGYRAGYAGLASGYGAGYAGLASGYGAGYAGLASGYGAGYAGLASGYGTGYAGLASGYGAGYADLASGYGAGYGYSASPLVSSNIGYSGYAPNYAASYGYSGPLNLNTQLIAHPNGAVVPLDEPAVAAARANHLDAQSAAYAASAPIIHAAPLLASAPLVSSAPYAAVNYGYSGPLNLNTQLIAHPNGAIVPLDEPAVAAARAEHLASKGVAYAASAPIIAAPVSSAPYADVGYGYAGPLNLNTQLIAHPNGAVVPIDEPAVAAARADHLATKGVYGGVYAAAGPVAYAAGYGAGYAPYAGLVAHPNGAVVPVDEPAVAAARAEHLAAHGY